MSDQDTEQGYREIKALLALQGVLARIGNVSKEEMVTGAMPYADTSLPDDVSAKVSAAFTAAEDAYKAADAAFDAVGKEIVKLSEQMTASKGDQSGS